jgi:nitrogen fixation protein NifX
MLTAAFATADGVHVDAHFGRCARFDIYDITAAGAQLRETRWLAAADDNDEDVRLQDRLDALTGCALVCVASIGPTAAARVVNSRVHPLKTTPTTTIASVLDRLQVVLQGTPPPWLRKLQNSAPAGGSP